MNKNFKIEKTTTNKQTIKNTYLLDGIYSKIVLCNEYYLVTAETGLVHFRFPKNMADVEGFREEATPIIHSLYRNLMTQDTDANLCEASLITLTALSRNAQRMCTRNPVFERLCEILTFL